MSTWTPILRAVVGSTAYGLATPDSDIDRIEVAAAPTADFHGLHPPVGKRASRVATNPDVAVHELGKYVALALGCNPTLLELLWLTPDLYEHVSDHGDELIRERGRFVFAHGVRTSFLGYAEQQLRKLAARGDGTYSSDVRNRSLKHGRHLWRLVRQGLQLHTMGTMTVRLDAAEVEECRRFSESVLRDHDVAVRFLADADERVARTSTPLPDRPDERWADAWLRHVRADLFRAEIDAPN